MRNLKPLKWYRGMPRSAGAVIETSADSPLHSYTIVCPDQQAGGYIACYFENMTNDSGTKFFNSVDEAKYWCEFTHYKDKMSQYVEPSVGWISTKDRLPAMYERVLIKSNCILVAGRQPKSEFNKDWGIKGDWSWVIINDSWCDADLVTHWMPLPRPPERGDQ